MTLHYTEVTYKRLLTKVTYKRLLTKSYLQKVTYRRLLTESYLLKVTYRRLLTESYLHVNTKVRYITIFLRSFLIFFLEHNTLLNTTIVTYITYCTIKEKSKKGGSAAKKILSRLFHRVKYEIYN